MIKIFETAKIKALDQYTIQHEPIESIELVERAATSFTQEFCRHFSKQRRIIIFAGHGNNGADSLAIARLLKEEGFRIELYLFNPSGNLSSECAINKQRLLAEGTVPLIEVFEDFTPPTITERDIIIDGLFGYGLNRPLTGGYAAVINYINQSEATVVSIDIPSGLFGEDNSNNTPSSIIQADHTFTFESPKLSFFFAENECYVGRWKVLRIGIHPEAIEQTKSPYNLVTEEDMIGLFPPRATFAHKGIFGHALLFAGGKGMMGAAVLAAEACLRSGAGKVTVHIPERGENILQTALPEAILSLDTNNDFISTLPEPRLYEAVGIGPGIGTEKITATLLEQLIKSVKLPLLLDADALNILASKNTLLSMLPTHSILTPHPKEFDRLFGESANSYDRLQKAIKAAKEHQLCIVLKGAFTAVCTPEGNVYFNPTGNPGMATAGSGDVLTGIILGLLALSFSSEAASVVGVYLHGLAGDLAVAGSSEQSVIAHDITHMLWKAFALTKENE